MAVAHDAVSESHTGTTGSTSEASFSWSHNPVGTPKGVLVFTFVAANADDATAVTYDGVALTAVSGGRAVDTLTEPGDCKAWFLGSSVPTTDPATVVVTRNNNANAMYAQCITVTALTDTEVYLPGIVLLQGNQTAVEQNVDDGTPGTNSLRYAAAFSGEAAGSSIPPGANSTALELIDFGAFIMRAVVETTAGQGSRPVGFAATGPDDLAAVHLAVREVVAGGTTVTPGVIARSFTVPAVTVKGSAVTAPSVISRSFTTPAPTVKGAAKTTPAAVAAVVTNPAPTVKGSAVAAPAAVALSFTIPQVTAGEGATPGTASPAITATTVAIDTVTVKGSVVTTPSAIERTFAVNAVTVKGSAVVAPAAIARSFTIPQVTPLEGATPGSASPATIARSFTVPATTVKGGAVATPATVARSFALDAVTVKGSAVTAPSTIARTFTLPSTVQAGSTVAAPSTIARSFTFGQVTPSGGAVVNPNVIPISVVMPAVTVSTVIPDFWNYNPAGYTLNPAAYAANPAVYTPVTKDDDPPWD